MEAFKWYRAEDHKDMSNSFNCIYPLEEAKENAIVLSYHLMIKDGKITQIMDGQTHIHDDMDKIWFPLKDEEIIEKANDWAAFIKAKKLLRSNGRRAIVSIKDDKLNKIWE